MFRSHYRQLSATFAALSLLTIGTSRLQSQNLPPQNLPVIGGSGGTAFTRDCGAGRVLTGLRYRGGLVIDAIGLLCRPVLSDGTLGPESTIGTLAGGGGGTIGVASCHSGKGITGLQISAGSYVSYVTLSCRTWQANTRTYSGIADVMSIGSLTTPSNPSVVQSCESTRPPGSGIRGRAASFVDAIGLVCDEP